MKKLIAGLFAVAAFSFSAFCQEKGAHTMKGDNRGKNEAMMEKLKLTDEQRAKMQSINEEFRQEMEKLNSSSGMSVDEMRATKKEIQEKRKSRIMEILNPEQKKLYSTAKDESNSGMHHDEMDLQELRTKLSLTDEQFEKLSEMHSSFEKKEASIKDDNTMDDAAKKQQLASLRKEHHEIMRAVLTADQLNKLEKEGEHGWKVKTQKGDATEKVKVKN